MAKKILIVDDDLAICHSLRDLLASRGFSTKDVQDGASVLSLLKSKKKQSFYCPDVILLDVQLPDIDGIDLLETIKKKYPEIIVIIITAFGSVPQSVEAMQKGATDYVLKPFNIDEILVRVSKAFENSQVRQQLGYLSDKVYGNWEEKYVQGSNVKMKKIYRDLDNIAKSSSTTVVVYGETGTGKEVIANRIHFLSNRKNKPFVEVNATALTAELLESELFGHEAGSFTGASQTKKGLFEVADGGTLFLDEIGDMDLSMQTKLLRALQERKIRRVGGTKHIEVDIRVITATNKNLEEEVKKGKFREDLFYRLNVIPIFLPSLRERREDVKVLTEHFIKTFNLEFGKEVEEIDANALNFLTEYSWPGNIRELRNCIERAMLLECNGPTLMDQHLHFKQRSVGEVGGGVRAVGIGNISKSPYSDIDLDKEKAEGSFSSIGQNISLESVEKEHIQKILESTNGKKNQAAQMLKIDRTTLYNKLKKYNIQ